MKMNSEQKQIVLKLDEPCKSCGSFLYEIRYKEPHVGLYCKSCNKWIKWLSKAERKKYGIVNIDSSASIEQTTQYNENTEELPW